MDWASLSKEKKQALLLIGMWVVGGVVALYYFVLAPYFASRSTSESELDSLRAKISQAESTMRGDARLRAEFNEATSLEWWVTELWGHRGLQLLFKDLNRIYRENPALWQLDNDPSGFRWINADDRGANTFSWLRSDADGNHVAVISNFSSEPWTAYRIGLPAAGVWEEVLNSDADLYDGTGNFGNLGQVTAIDEPWNGLPASATVVVPPLGTVYLRQRG